MEPLNQLVYLRYVLVKQPHTITIAMNQTSPELFEARLDKISA